MSYSTEHHTPFELTDCDRVKLQVADEVAGAYRLPPVIDDDRKFVDRMISEYGYAVYPINTGSCSHPGCDGGSGENPWSYTVGRAFFGVPELVTTGLDGDGAMRVSNTVGQLVPWEWRAGDLVEAERQRFRLDAVPSEWLFADMSRMATWFAAFAPFHRLSEPDVFQVVWPDDRGRFPDDPACDAGVVSVQPLLAADPVAYPPIDVDLLWCAGPPA